MIIYTDNNYLRHGLYSSFDICRVKNTPPLIILDLGYKEFAVLRQADITIIRKCSLLTCLDQCFYVVSAKELYSILMSKKAFSPEFSTPSENSRLSPREADILGRLLDGQTIQKVAEQLKTTAGAIYSLKSNGIKKLACRNLTQLARRLKSLEARLPEIFPVAIFAQHIPELPYIDKIHISDY